MPTYASPADLASFTGRSLDSLPADADRLLVRAGEVVDFYVRAGYTVDGDGLPTSASVIAAFRDATCAQVEFWFEVDEAHDIDGGAGTQISVTGFTGTRAPELAPRARRLLTSAGLMSGGSIDSTLVGSFFKGCC